MNDTVTGFLTMGTILGLSAGFIPGPLLTLTISETIQHDIKAGIKVAMAPVITDLPIIVLTLFILSKLSRFNHILGTISLCGSCLILYMGYKSFQARKAIPGSQKGKTKSLTKGILANFLSPSPYTFWSSVGAPLTTKAMGLGMIAPMAFIGSFYFFLVGSKILIALLVSRSKSFLLGSYYIYLMRFLGLVLCVLAFMLFYDGLKLFKLL